MKLRTRKNNSKFLTLIVIWPTLLFLYGMFLKFKIYSFNKGKFEIFGVSAGYIHFVIAGLCMFIGAITLYYEWYLLKHKPEVKERVASQVNFFLTEGSAALTIASGISLFLFGLYLVFPSTSDLSSRFSVALSIYTSIFAATIAIEAFYVRTQAITDVDILLKFLTRDLIEKSASLKRLIIVFPALNIGYHRGCIRKDYELFKIFEQALRSCLLYDPSPDIAIAVTYKRNLYIPLYECYQQQVNGSTNVNLFQGTAVVDPIPYQCVEVANRMLDLFKYNSAQQNSTNYTILELLPDAMPQHVIAINDVVYTIMTYGMPIFNEVDNCFEPFDQGKKS